MRAKPILAALAAVIVLALIVRQVSQAVRHTFSARSGIALLDHSSPAEQNGLTLVEIDNVSPDRFYNYTEKGPQDGGGSSPAAPAADTGLWIKLPPGVSPSQNCDSSENNGCSNLFTITGRTSTGETFPMSWRVSRYTPNNASEICVLLTTIPAGYPNTVHWADVTLDDKHGDKATWRITHLPPMQHVLGPGTTAQTTFQQGSIHAVARAFGGPSPYTASSGGPSPPVVMYDVKGTITGAAHQWELGHMSQTFEWEPPGFTPKENGSTTGTGKVGSMVNLEIQQQVDYNRSTPYLADIHFVRLVARLQEFETFDETVTFHNLSVVKTKRGNQYVAGSGPQTVTTPSGVSVTLDDVQHQQKLTNDNDWGGDGYSLHLLYPQTRHYPSLPRSPFWRKYKRAVTVSAEIPKPYDSSGAGYSDTEGTYHFRVKTPLPSVIPNFPVIIRQRVDLQAVPMTFTLPVLKKQPGK